MAHHVHGGPLRAVPFSGFDTLPALGVVIVPLGVLHEDFTVVAVGLMIGSAGIGLEVAVGTAALVV